MFSTSPQKMEHSKSRSEVHKARKLVNKLLYQIFLSACSELTPMAVIEKGNTRFLLVAAVSTAWLWAIFGELGYAMG